MKVRYGIACVLLSVLGACGADPCGDVPMSDSPTAPRIENIDLVEQLPGDPWQLIFALQFSDSDGDLSPGNVSLFLNRINDPVVFALSDLFLQSGVPLDAGAGTIVVAPRFAETVDDGAKVWLGMQLEDAADQRSNCYGVKLRFDVD